MYTAYIDCSMPINIMPFSKERPGHIPLANIYVCIYVTGITQYQYPNLLSCSLHTTA